MLGFDILQKMKSTQYYLNILTIGSSVALVSNRVESELWLTFCECASPVLTNRGVIALREQRMGHTLRTRKPEQISSLIQLRYMLRKYLLLRFCKPY